MLVNILVVFYLENTLHAPNAPNAIERSNAVAFVRGIRGGGGLGGLEGGDMGFEGCGLGSVVWGLGFGFCVLGFA